MKKVQIFTLCIIATIITGCADDNNTHSSHEKIETISLDQQKLIHDTWRVDMILVSNQTLDALTEYIYNADNKLTKITLSEENNTLNTVTRSEIALEYDNQGQLIIPNDNSTQPANRDYKYNGKGQLVQTYSYVYEGIVYADYLEWDNKGNVVRLIRPRPLTDSDLSFGHWQPIPGTSKEDIYEFEYDNHPKPNFGVDGAFVWDGRFNPWPSVDISVEQLARSLSHNNLTLCKMSGVAYRYTYNDEGLPETVQTIRLGVESSQPMIQTLIYTRAK
jgi:hypothetical protein